MAITASTIESAPMFTIFRGGNNVAEVNELDGRYDVYWRIVNTEDDPCDDEVMDNLELDGHLCRMVLVNGFPVTPEVCLDRADEDGVAHLISDIDAALWALNNEYDLIKVPDEVGQPSYRLYLLKDPEEG